MSARLFTSLLMVLAAAPACAATLAVVDETGAPLATAMVREMPATRAPADIRDGGYPLPAQPFVVETDITRFTDAAGRVRFDERGRELITVSGGKWTLIP